MLVFNGSSRFLTLKICYIIIYIQLLFQSCAIFSFILHMFSTGSHSCLRSPFTYNRKILIPFIKLTPEAYNNWLQVVIIRVFLVIHYNCNVTIVIFVISVYPYLNIYCIIFCLFSNRYLLCMFLLLRMIRLWSKRLLLAFFIKIST